MSFLNHQYEFIKNTRRRLFNYCKNISDENFIKGHNDFGKRSIQYLLIHNANVYQFYLKNFLENKGFPPSENYLINKIDLVIDHYEKINQITNDFNEKFKDNWDKKLIGKIPNYELTLEATPLKLFTHAVTHEFHHKGQIMTMSRLLGYKPIDSDIIYFA